MTGLVLLVGVFILLGVVFSMGKGAFLIAGYNTMSNEQKARYDTTALCRFMGKMMFALSGSMILWLLYDVWDVVWLLTAGIVLFAGIILFMLVYLNTGDRFKK